MNIANRIRRIVNWLSMREHTPSSIPEGCVYFSGDYSSWADALNDSRGYDDAAILRKVRDAAMKVKTGEAVYERDSVLFDHIEYSWPVLSALLWVAARHGGRLSVLDFGGSLGTSYYQNRKFLRALPDIHWGVVEQPHFVDVGKRDFQDGILKFYHDLDEIMRCEKPPHVALLSGVLQCVDEPYELMKAILDMNLDAVIVDIFPVLNDGRDRLTVEHVPASIYEASYPAWFFNKESFTAYVEGNGYELVEEFSAYVGDTLYLTDGTKGYDVGFIFQKK